MNLEKHLFKSDSFQKLINEAISFFCSTPLESLPPDNNFAGAGVYALYYKGNLAIYQAIYENKPEIPIYVGKAVLPGWRQGRTTGKENEPALYRRLKQHSRSISATNNLDLDDFYCKFMVFSLDDSDLIGAVEAALIRKYQPLWNSLIDGFGNHDPGKGRYEQAKSEWDVLHAGREWANKLKGKSPKLNDILRKINNEINL